MKGIECATDSDWNFNIFRHREMSEPMLRNTIGQLMAAIRLICIMERQGRSDVIREIEGCLSEDMTFVAHSDRLDQVIKAHIDVLDPC